MVLNVMRDVKSGILQNGEMGIPNQLVNFRITLLEKV
jgi:hypothetical protein